MKVKRKFKLTVYSFKRQQKLSLINFEIEPVSCPTGVNRLVGIFLEFGARSLPIFFKKKKRVILENQKRPVPVRGQSLDFKTVFVFEIPPHSILQIFRFVN